MKLVFFGSSQFSVFVLEELKLHDILPSLIITTPDKPKGRKLVLSPTPTKIWAETNGIECIAPSTLKNNVDLIFGLSSKNYNLFLVASYGKIIPKEIFEIPKHKTLNIHPSLLPKYRGASPIQTQILNNEKKIGVSIMQIEERMDAGPIIVQRPHPTHSPWQGEGQGTKGAWGEVMLGKKELEKTLAIEGARLFAHILPEWLQGVIKPIMQNEKEAIYCNKIKKEDGELQIDLNDLSKNADQNILKIKAFEEWPEAYFFVEKNNKKIRVIIKKAIIKNNSLEILRVLPESKKEMSFSDFLRGLN